MGKAIEITDSNFAGWAFIGRWFKSIKFNSNSSRVFFSLVNISIPKTFGLSVLTYNFSVAEFSIVLIILWKDMISTPRTILFGQ